jgi:membrane fusion protein, multidrug efflux system
MLMKHLAHPRLVGRLALWLSLALPLAAPAAEPPRPMEVLTVRPARGDITRFATLPGSIRARQQAMLYAKVAGYLKSISVDRGDHVKAGQVLAEIEVPELLADLARYKAELKVADIESRRTAEAQKKASDLVTPQSVDSALGRLEIAQSNLERVETLLRYSKLVAPFDGVVTTRHVDPGAFIPVATSGSAAGNAAIVMLMDFSTVRVQVAVPELEASLLREGQPVKVTTEGLPGKFFEGKVSRISYALDELSRTMLVEADLPNPQLLLRPGMYATVRIGIEKHENALLVPVDALVMEKANAFVFIADSGHARKARIQTGFNDGVNVETVGGLTGNEAVIRVGKMSLADGQAVNLKGTP